MWKEGTRVALLACGSYNPPTIMHLRMMEVAKDHMEKNLQCQVVEGILSPVADAFGKPNLVSAAHRHEMIRRAVKDSKWMHASNWECNQTNWTRTLAVMEYHKKRLQGEYGPDTKLILVVGGDVVDSFPKILPNGENLWKLDDIKEIIGYGLIVFQREGSFPRKTLQDLAIPSKMADTVQIVEDEVCPCQVSSTRIRAAIAAGRSINYVMPYDVIQYINENGLYKGKL